MPDRQRLLIVDDEADFANGLARDFVYNLADPAVQEQIRTLGASYVQWDVLFDTSFAPNANATPPSFGPSSPRPALRYLRLPFQF